MKEHWTNILDLYNRTWTYKLYSRLLEGQKSSIPTSQLALEGIT